MDLRFYNTATHQVEPFIPGKSGEVRVYSCGPTVYSRQHIGNLRAAVFADILKRTLRASDLIVIDVVNITDVGHLVSDEDQGEDKLEKAARRENRDPAQIARDYENQYIEDLHKLNVILPKYLPRATEHIAEQISFIQALEDRGFTYTTRDGIYFDTSKFEDYGALSGQSLEEKRAGARVDERAGKRHPRDFALWKFLVDENAEHIMRWESPWGVGFPGWHIECSAMSHKYLGEHIDIHTGGFDHIPIHHENERAQNMCSGLIQDVRFWIHNEFLRFEGGKMAKSLGNVVTLNELEERNIDPLSLRYWFMTAKYRQPIDFSWTALEAAATALRRLHTHISDLRLDTHAQPDEKFVTSIRAYLVDDLNTPEAIKEIWNYVNGSSQEESVIRASLRAIEPMLGLGLDTLPCAISYMKQEELPEAVQKLILDRQHARDVKDWGTADKLREEILRAGYEIKDVSDGIQIVKV